MTACHLQRPKDTDAVGPDDGQRPLLLVQAWTTPDGQAAEVAMEPHHDHVHLWWRWDGYWDIPPSGGDEDWDHFLDCVWPIARDVIAAVSHGAPLDSSSAEMVTFRRERA